MPVNLNALIRYKTLDRCFKKISTVTDIDYLVQQCATAIYDATGNTSGISERTIRNDIRVMRSDILGFNAPIIVEKGIYKYSNPNYSIFEKPFDDLELLKDIQDLLIDEFNNIQNENLPYLLKALSSITQKEVSKEYLPPEYKPSPPGVFESKIPNYYLDEIYSYIRSLKSQKRGFFKKKSNTIFKWKFIMQLI